MENFVKLDDFRQEEILKIAIKEFGEKGFKSASTTDIAKRAGIGKGTLFFYFNTKVELYRYIIEYGLKYLKEKYFDKIDNGNSDFIERLRDISRLKLELYLDKPYIFDFFINTQINEKGEYVPEDLKKEIEKMMSEVPKRIYENIDRTMFRKDLDEETNMKLIRWSVEGYQKELERENRARESDGFIVEKVR